MTIDTRQGPITIATSYIPPRTNYINFIDFNKLFNKPHPTYLFADLNAKHYTLGCNSINRRGQHIDYFIKHNKCTHIGPNFPTFFGHNSQTNPDIVLQNAAAYHNIKFEAGPTTPSDHIPIIATLSANPLQIKIKPRKCFHKVNWDKYRNEFDNIDSQINVNSTKADIDKHLDIWTNAIKSASDKHIPTLNYRVIPGIRATHDIQSIEILYNSLINDIKTTGPNYDKYTRLIELRRNMNDRYKQLYNENWARLIDKLQTTTNSAQFHKSINRMMGTAQKSHAPYLKDNTDNRAHTPQEKEALFTEHWKEIFTEDEDNDAFDKDNIEAVTQYMLNNKHLTTTYDCSDLNRLDIIQMPYITIEELIQTLRTFKQKAPGPTGITTLQIKQLTVKMKYYLLNIFNHAISTGYFPDKLKHANIIFIPKPNKSPHLVQNYRPISLLDVHGKLLDKILNNRLYRHLSNNNILHDRQHGFRRLRGTDTALATLYETLSISQAQRHTTYVVLRDVTKAFDKVWTLGLQYKIAQLNLHINFTKTLNNYLINRTASVSIQTHIGPPIQLQSGVPQGACLSPTLYSLYTNDIPQPLPKTDYIAFADDITQISTGKHNYRFTALNTRRAIEQINNFERRWKIQTNTTKFTVIPISRRKTADISIDNTIIPYKNSGTVLGLHFNTHGFTPQIAHRKGIATANLNKLARFSNLPPRTKKKLYLTYVRPALIYPIIPIHTQSKTQISKLQKIQNKATRFITGTTRADSITSQHLHKITGLQPINIVLHEQAHKIWQKIENNIPTLYEQLSFPPNTKEHSRFRSSKTKANLPTPEPVFL